MENAIADVAGVAVEDENVARGMFLVSGDPPSMKAFAVLGLDLELSEVEPGLAGRPE
jgi:hypothetical protein